MPDPFPVIICFKLTLWVDISVITLIHKIDDISIFQILGIVSFVPILFLFQKQLLSIILIVDYRP